MADELEQATWQVEMPPALAARYFDSENPRFRWGLRQSLERLARLYVEEGLPLFNFDPLRLFFTMIHRHHLRVKQAREFLESYVRTYGQLIELEAALDSVDSQAFEGEDGIPAADNDIFTRMTHNSIGLMLDYTDPNGLVNTYEYDGLYRQQVMRDPDGEATTYTYDDVGNLQQVRDPLGNGYRYTYDGLYRQTEMTSLAHPDRVTHMDYDALGRVVAQTDAEGIVQQMGYDPLGRMVWARKNAVAPYGSIDIKKTRTHAKELHPVNRRP